MSAAGKLYGIGVGPGDPELLTVKGQRVLREADLIAYTAKAGERGRARETVAPYLKPGQRELPFCYPLTTEQPNGASYRQLLDAFYDTVAERLAQELSAGETVALLCEGDPFLYGSYAYLHERLADRFAVEVVPGVPSFCAAAAAAGKPLAKGEDLFLVAPATAPQARLKAGLGVADSAALLKLGRRYREAREALAEAGLEEGAYYVERASLPAEQVAPAQSVSPSSVPYMATLIVPSAGQGPPTNQPAARSGQLAVVGIGPGAPHWLTAEAKAVLAGAEHLIGYGPYLARLQPRPDQVVHPSDNRQERARALLALSLAAEGRRVAVVSSGDPGIFAMAATVLEVLEEKGADTVEVRVVPGVSAMQVAAARVGAPLGHDFCVISLSDNLKPLPVIEARLRAACQADLLIALYNPAGKVRRIALERAYALLLEERPAQTPLVVARALGSAQEEVRVCALGELDLNRVDMRTVLIVGSSQTRVLRAGSKPLLYTPRSYPHAKSAGPQPLPTH